MESGPSSSDPTQGPAYCLQVSRPEQDTTGASSIWLASNVENEFSEWKEMLNIAANKRRSQVGVIDFSLPQ